jgi:hypothetical protein
LPTLLFFWPETSLTMIPIAWFSIVIPPFKLWSVLLKFWLGTEGAERK